MAVISLGGTVVSTSLKVAGDDFDEAIVRYMKKKHNLLIGDRTAEDIKIKIGTTYPLIENEAMEVSGRNLVTGLPKTVTVTSAETERALQGTSNQIIEAIISVLERTPPELSADILERGIVLTGGGAKLRGTGRDDRGENRNQYNDCRGADAGRSNRNRRICGTYERKTRTVKNAEAFLNCRADLGQ